MGFTRRSRGLSEAEAIVRELAATELNNRNALRQLIERAQDWIARR